MGERVNNLKKVIKVIVNCLTIILVIVLMLVIYSKLSLTFFHKNYPNYFGYTLFEVASGSMSPTLNINDVILVKITKDNLKENDIIAFQEGDAIITHRIIFVNGTNLTVKGDSNNTADKPIEVNQIIGKVIKVYPQLGVWKKVIMEPKILVAIFVTLLLFDFALSYKTDNQKKQKKESKNNKKENDVIIKKIEVKDELEKNTKEEQLLELTRKINIEDINKLLEEEKNIEVEKEVNDNIESTEPKKNEDLNYTIRLDLNEIQNRIGKKIR